MMAKARTYPFIQDNNMFSVPHKILKYLLMSTIGFLPSLTYWFTIWEIDKSPLTILEQDLMFVSILFHIVPFLFLCLFHECRRGRATNWSIYTGYTVMAIITIFFSINNFYVMHFSLSSEVWCAPSLVTLPVVSGVSMIVGYFLAWALKEQIP